MMESDEKAFIRELNREIREAERNKWVNGSVDPYQVGRKEALEEMRTMFKAMVRIKR